MRRTSLYLGSINKSAYFKLKELSKMGVILLILIFIATCNADVKWRREEINDGTTEILWQEAFSISNGISCEFEGNDLSSVSSVDSFKCMTEICRNNKECTHYTWTSKNGGTCYLKMGSVSKSEARFKDLYKTHPESWMCGIDHTKGKPDRSDRGLSIEDFLAPITHLIKDLATTTTTAISTTVEKMTTANPRTGLNLIDEQFLKIIDYLTKYIK